MNNKLQTLINSYNLIADVLETRESVAATKLLAGKKESIADYVMQLAAQGRLYIRTPRGELVAIRNKRGKK